MKLDLEPKKSSIIDHVFWLTFILFTNPGGILEALGKKVRIVCGQPVPPNLTFIDPTNRIMCIHEDIQPEDLADADLHMILDTSAWIQLGEMADVIRNSSYKKIIFEVFSYF